MPLETPAPTAEGGAQPGAPGDYFRVLVTAVSPRVGRQIGPKLVPRFPPALLAGLEK